MLGQQGGLAQKADLPDDPTWFLGGWGQFRSCFYSRNSTLALHFRLRDSTLALLRYTFGLVDMAGSTFEVCLCLSLYSSFVALVRFEVLFPQSAFERFLGG